MQGYMIRRILLIIPTVFLVTLAVFFMVRLIPGDLLDVMADDYEAYGEDARAALEAALGLDKPVHEQYFVWLWDIARGDLGTSLWSKQSVASMILYRLPVTIELGIMSLIISVSLAVPIGIYSAIRADAPGDYIARSFAIMLIAMPGFWVATLVIAFGSIWFRWSPPLRVVSFGDNPLENLATFIIPAIILGTHMIGTSMRMTRTMMLEVLRQDYIRTAWSKGLRERIVVVRHALKNAMIPVITLIGLQVPLIIGGSVIIEQIFGLPGMGRLFIRSTQLRDYTTISGIVFMVAFFVLAVNLVVDLTYNYLDPRIRYK